MWPKRKKKTAIKTNKHQQQAWYGISQHQMGGTRLIKVAGGRRSTAGGWKKEIVTEAGWDFCPGEKPQGGLGRGYEALLSVYSRKSETTSPGASREHGNAVTGAHSCFGRVTPQHGTGDSTLATGHVQPGWSPWELRRVVSAPLRSLSSGFNHLLTQVWLFPLGRDAPRRTTFPHAAAGEPVGHQFGAAGLPGLIVAP